MNSLNSSVMIEFRMTLSWGAGVGYLEGIIREAVRGLVILLFLDLGSGCVHFLKIQVVHLEIVHFKNVCFTSIKNLQRKQKAPSISRLILSCH